MNRKIDIYEPDEIKDIIDFLKTEKTITNITEAAGISTIYTDSICLLKDVDSFNLLAGMIVTLANINYQVLTVSTTYFTITATGLYTTSGTPPVKTLLVTKWNLAINSKFGSRMEINELLDLESKATNTKNIRFPLIWLFINEPETAKELDFDHKSNLKFAFAYISAPENRAQARLDNVLKKVLQPLLSLFIQTIYSPYFRDKFIWEYGQLPNKKYNRYFYGSSDKNQMVLDAPTDAIEIDLDLIFQNQY